MTAGVRAQQGQPPTFKAGVDLVNFGVMVVDKQGKPVTGLTADDFEIVENGKKQTVTFFAAGDPEAAPPLHLGLLLDTSGSMADDLKMRGRPRSSSSTRSIAPRISRSSISTRRYASRGFPPRIIRGSSGGFASGRPTAGRRSTMPSVISTARSVSTARSARPLHRRRRHDQHVTFHDMLDLVKASDVTVYAVGYIEHQGQQPHGSSAPISSASP